jgi:hypothetical protein
MGLHPWEFYQYDLVEYLQMRDGKVKARHRELKQNFQHTQILAYYMILPYLEKKDRHKKIDELIPNIYDDKPAKVVSLKEQYERIQQKYAGIANVPVKRKKDGSK